ncbi:MAG: type I-F CRISPR-associated endoribonuclease Cas6/Csy4 [Gammaproteobacteria bacterium RIFOXYA12_FULL_61_12]|nr:MAG: type I-F CRISPR-associated endoribonuclease Cas6/Csy4 [Gammaproteobacteria bacterium RIFOXYA12_FULL_61_12]OGT88448.1 MAG: type I-F CRISPR-associated endoribonuclease Cas6/Csy4 [Gammaproteobacteria bacterium RIFOXYD12_FULL_61_37]
MDTYIDIRLLPDPEFPSTLLMNALFGKLHRGLVTFGEGSIGVSFPDVGQKSHSLGHHLRLHGTAATLERFMQNGWLKGMSDHLTVGSPSAVPAHAQYRTVRRVQAKSNPERERRRLIARKGVSEDQARAAIPDEKAKLLDLPYVVLNSQSTNQQFRLFIEHMPKEAEARAGSFSAYGLSTTATVPWF